jgi:hypothetical protein
MWKVEVGSKARSRMRRRFVPGEPGRNSRHQSHDMNVHDRSKNSPPLNNIKRLGKFLWIDTNE